MAITVRLPASGVYVEGMSEARRLMVGGESSRSWWAFTWSGTLYVVHYRQNGHGADPTVFVPALSAATALEVDLGAVEVTAAENYTATAARLATAGITGVTDEGADAEGRQQLEIADAFGLWLPPEVDTLDNSLRGCVGVYRSHWGGGAGTVALNNNGGTAATVAVHIEPLSALSGIPAGRAARIVGAYAWGHGGNQPLLGVGTGPAHNGTSSPGAITIEAEGILPTALNNGDFGHVTFANPVAITTDDELWVLHRGDVATSPGGTMYRDHGETVPGNGALGVGEVMIIDTVTAHANTDSFGPTYTPIASATFVGYLAVGLKVDIANAAGDFHGRGAQTFVVGDHNPDPSHGTQFSVPTATLNPETTHQRQLLMDLPGEMNLREVRRAINEVPSDEDCRAALYGPWTDLTVPTLTLPPLIADLGLLGLAGNPNGFTALTLEPPIDISSAAGSYWSFGCNYSRDGGGAAVGIRLPVYIDAAVGDDSFTNCWLDDRDTWHDGIVGASSWALSSGVAEYQTPGTGGNTMPTDDWADVWVTPFDGIDGTSPIAIVPDRSIIDRTLSQLAATVTNEAGAATLTSASTFAAPVTDAALATATLISTSTLVAPITDAAHVAATLISTSTLTCSISTPVADVPPIFASLISVSFAGVFANIIDLSEGIQGASFAHVGPLSIWTTTIGDGAPLTLALTLGVDVISTGAVMVPVLRIRQRNNPEDSYLEFNGTTVAGVTGVNVSFDLGIGIEPGVYVAQVLAYTTVGRLVFPRSRNFLLKFIAGQL